MAVGPDVYQAHQEDTERYVLTNLNMVSVPWAGDSVHGADHEEWSAGASAHSMPHWGFGAEWEWASLRGGLNSCVNLRLGSCLGPRALGCKGCGLPFGSSSPPLLGVEVGEVPGPLLAP